MCALRKNVLCVEDRKNGGVCALGKVVPRVANVRTEPSVLLERLCPCGEQEQTRTRSGKGCTSCGERENRAVCALGKATPVRRTGKKRHLGKHPARKAGKSAVPKRKAGARDGHGMICLYRSPFGRKHRCTGWIRAGAVPWDRDFWLAPLLPGFHRVALLRAGRRHTRL